MSPSQVKLTESIKPMEENSKYLVYETTLRGFEVYFGGFTLYSIYKTSNTEIEITLYSEDYKIVNTVQYSSTSAELKNIEEEKTLKDF